MQRRPLAFVLVLLGCATRAHAPASPPVAAQPPVTVAETTPIEVVPAPTPASSARPDAGVIRGRVLRAGRAFPQRGVDAVQAAPATASGYIHMTPATSVPEFLPEGTPIHACLGFSFGVGVLISGAREGKVILARVRVTHPPITDPRLGRSSTVDEWDAPMNAGIERYTGWRFDQPSELVPGSWRFEVLVENQVIAAQELNVIAPSDPADCESEPRARTRSVKRPD
jgi:hypothetical protein